MDYLNKFFPNRWLVGNPVILARVLRGFARALLLRKNTIKTIELFPTMRCNLRCEMCSVDGMMMDDIPELELGDYEQIARQGATLGAVAVSFLGGEPLMYEHLEPLVGIFKKHHFYTYMVSNGLLATRKRLKALKRAGLDYISFSVDSMDGQRHNSIRGMPGLFDKTLRACATAREEGLTTGLSTVFFPGKLEQALEVVEHCARNGLGMSAGQVAPIGSWHDGETLSSQEHDRIRRIVGQYPRLTMDWSMSYFLKMRCPAGKEKLAITTGGEVLGCSVNPVSFGNIRNEPLKDIIGRMQRFSYFRRDVPVCLAAEHTEYIEKIMRPMGALGKSPVPFREHPNIRESEEPDIFVR